MPGNRDPDRGVVSSIGRVAATGIAVAGLSAAVAACGPGKSSAGGAGQPADTGVTGSTTPSRARPSKAPRHTASQRPTGQPVGRTRSVNAHGTRLSVVVSKVIDPLRGSGAALLPGTRVVAVFVRIHNRGPGGYDSSSTGDISIIPSSGVGSPAYASRGACKTPDRDFDNAIGPGENRAGCVVFSLDATAKLVGERFSADGGGAGSVTWRGPKT